MQQDVCLEAESRPAPLRLVRPDPHHGDPVAQEDSLDGGQDGGVAVVDRADRVQQAAAGLGLQPCPGAPGPSGEGAVVVLEVSAAEDARLAVGRAAVVAPLELLDEHHAIAALGEGAGCRRSDQAGSDDDDLSGHGVSREARRTPSRTTRRRNPTSPMPISAAISISTATPATQVVSPVTD